MSKSHADVLRIQHTTAEGLTLSDAAVTLVGAIVQDATDQLDPLQALEFTAGLFSGVVLQLEATAGASFAEAALDTALKGLRARVARGGTLRAPGQAPH